MKLLDENLLLQKKEYDKLINERDTIGNLTYTMGGGYITIAILYDMICTTICIYMCV